MNDFDQLHGSKCDDACPPRSSTPDLYMPAMPPLGPIHALRSWIRAYKRRRRFRQHFLSLLDYDDPILEDLGHCRDEIEWASRLPLREDASQALLSRRARRRQFNEII